MSRLIDVDKFKAVNGMKDDCADCDKELREKSKACEFDRVYTKMDFCGWLDDAPTVDAVPVVHGWWFIGDDGSLHCSKCSKTPISRIIVHGIQIFDMAPVKEMMKYCPNCGAKMDGKDGEQLMCGRIVNLDTVARVLADYYHLKTDAQLAALDEALSRVPAVSVGGGYRKDHVVDPGNMVGDSISRAAAIEAIKEDKIDLTDPNAVAVFKATGDFEKAETQSMTCDRHIKILKDLPSAQQERKKGKWLPDNNNYYEERFICSVCGKSYKVDTCMGKPMWDFCPCGADMRGEQDG